MNANRRGPINSWHQVHLDTDLGGDIDDLCALALLLRYPEEVHLSAVTTVAEANGRRAGYVRYLLDLEGLHDTPVAAGADVSQGYYRYPQLDYPAEDVYWPESVAPLPGPIDEALTLLKQSIEQGATIIAIGPFTNLFLLDQQYPGILEEARLFLMGGSVYPTRPGFPDWDYRMDWNIQVDMQSARHVIQHANPTLIPLTVTVETALRRSYLDRLRKAGRLAQLIARQAEAFAVDEQNERRFGETCAGLPPDIINFQHDPLACAIALGWEEGVAIEEAPLLLEEEEGWLVQRTHPAGKPVRIVTKVDAAKFNEFWLNQVTKA